MVVTQYKKPDPQYWWSLTKTSKRRHRVYGSSFTTINFLPFGNFGPLFHHSSPFMVFQPSFFTIYGGFTSIFQVDLPATMAFCGPRGPYLSLGGWRPVMGKTGHGRLEGFFTFLKHLLLGKKCIYI